MRSLIGIVVLGLASFVQTAQAQSNHDALVTKHAAANGVPESLVRRVIRIESTGNPGLVSRGNYGLMQIRLGTAKAMGYAGGADGLLDADTNMTYAVRYLAGAYRLAGGNESRAVAYYQRGYYQQAKARGVSPYAAPPTFAAPPAFGAAPTLAASSSEPAMLAQPVAFAEPASAAPPAVTRRTERRRARAAASGAPFNLLAFLADKGMTQEDKQRLRMRRGHGRRSAAR
jgi:hypothetical protein